MLLEAWKAFEGEQDWRWVLLLCAVLRNMYCRSVGGKGRGRRKEAFEGEQDWRWGREYVISASMM